MSAITKAFDRFTEASLDDETVIMRVDTGEFYSLSDTATVIWRLIDGTRDRNALLATIAKEYGVGEGQVESDLDVLLAELKDLGLVSGG